MIYTFVKTPHECGNIEGCRFEGNLFMTDDPKIADRLRKSYTFGKTVSEIIVESEPEQAEQVIEPPAPEPEPNKYKYASYHELISAAQERGIEASGSRKEIEELLMEYDNEYK